MLNPCGEIVLVYNNDLVSFHKHCGMLGDRYRMRNRNGRYYLTIMVGRASKDDYWKRIWKSILTWRVQCYFPEAYMTSGSPMKATFFIGTVFDLMK